MINIEINISSACLNAFVRIGDIELIETAFHWPLQSVVRSLEVLFCFSLPWCMVLMRRVCVHIFHCNKKKTTERKVRIEEQKHAKREDNDRFRNYSCVCVCVFIGLALYNKMYKVHLLEGDSPQRVSFSHHYHQFNRRNKSCSSSLSINKIKLMIKKK